MKTGEIISGYAAELSGEERAIVRALHAARLAGLPVPSAAALAAAAGQGFTGNIPSLIQSIAAKGRICGIDFFRPPPVQNVLPFGVPEGGRLPYTPYHRKKEGVGA